MRSKPKEFPPCVNCKIRSTSPPKAVICIRNGRCWWWNRSERRSHSCRCLSGIFSVSGICWHRRFAGVLRRAQYRVSEQNPVPIARNIIAAKIQASKRVLQRQIRNYGENTAIQSAVDSLNISLRQLKGASELDLVHGIEGDAAE